MSSVCNAMQCSFSCHTQIDALEDFYADKWQFHALVKLNGFELYPSLAALRSAGIVS